MRLRRRLALAAALAPLAPAAGGQSVWYAVRGADQGFIVDMPGEPAYKMLDIVSPRGTRYVNHSYSLDSGRLSFVAQAAQLPADVDLGDPRRALQAILDERATRLDGGRWARVDWRPLPGGLAVESSGPVAGGRALRQLVGLRGRRLVSLAALGPADALHQPDAERFFASLRFPS